MIYINNRKNYFYLGGLLFVAIILTLVFFPKNDTDVTKYTLNGVVLTTTKETLTVRDLNNVIYTFNATDTDSTVSPGEEVVIEYTGLLNKSREVQNATLTGITPVASDEESYQYIRGSNGGIFKQFNTLASNKLKSMTLDEKIGQLLLVQYPGDIAKAKEALEKYKLGGYVFFEKDFQDKEVIDVQNMMKELQNVANIPILTAVDEEGGTVVRVSSNPKLVASKFQSPKEVYGSGGLDAVKKDTIKKSEVLGNLGINVNLAPVVDVSTSSGDYIYPRALGEGTTVTSQYAKEVINASKDGKVSYVLKHFPGYGNNGDTHNGQVLDNREYATLETNDIPPFEAGIDAGAEAVLVSHNVVTKIDSNNPASLSPSIHNLLRNNLNFTGLIITDDLSMKAVSSIENATVKAILAGNDIIMVTDYEKSIQEIKDALRIGTLSEEAIDNAAHRIISWKYYKGLMYTYQK